MLTMIYEESKLRSKASKSKVTIVNRAVNNFPRLINATGCEVFVKIAYLGSLLAMEVAKNKYEAKKYRTIS